MKIASEDALVVVDVQNDFCKRGALAVPGGEDVVPIINAVSPRFEHCVFTRDWHPPGHCSFSATPEYVDGSWPIHCVAETEGAAFCADLDVPEDAVIIDKGTRRDREAYSGFDGTDLAARLRALGVKRVFVCGIATDYCVMATVLDALANGFEAVLLEDACRAVDNPPGAGAAAVHTMRHAGVSIASTGDLE